MITKKQILDYISNTPHNTNRLVMDSFLDDFLSSNKKLEEKQINFFDYDGTLLYSYTNEEVQKLSSLPPLPTQEGLICNGWSYNLSDIKNWANDGYIVDSLPLYETSDNITKLYLHIEDETMLDFNMYLQIANGTLTVKCNGQTLATETESSNSYTNHTVSFTLPYSQTYPADYVLELEFEGSGGVHIGQGSSTTRIFGADVTHNNALTQIRISGFITYINDYAFYSCTSLKKVVLSLNSGIGQLAFVCCPIVTIVLSTPGYLGPSSFYGCSLLKCVVIFSSAASKTYGINSSQFSFCTSLKSIVIPSSVTGIFSSGFKVCASLRSIVLSSGVTELTNSIFANCTSLESIVIPSSVTKILNNAFKSCSYLSSIDMSGYTNPNSIPSLGSTNAFDGIDVDFKLLVANQEMLSAFSSATNWSAYKNSFIIKT